MTPLPKTPLAQARAALAAVEQNVKALLANLDKVADAAEAEPFEAAAMAAEASSRIGSSVADAAKRLAAIAASLVSGADIARETYVGRLRSRLAQQKLSIGGDANTLAVEGIVIVRFDRESGNVSVNDHVQADARVAAVAEAISERIAQLRKHGREPKTFGKEVLSAYRAELKVSGKPEGDQIRLDTLHMRLTLDRQSKAFSLSPSVRNFREYTREQLRADMYELLRAGGALADGKCLHVDSGAETAGALWMWVPSLGRLGYVGRVRVGAA